MGPVWLLLLLVLPPLLRAQVTPDLISGASVEPQNSTDSLLNITGTSEGPPAAPLSPSGPSGTSDPSGPTSTPTPADPVALSNSSSLPDTVAPSSSSSSPGTVYPPSPSSPPDPVASPSPSSPPGPSSPSEPPGFAPTPSEAPAEEEDWSPAEMFLYSGDPVALRAGECSRAYSLPGLAGPLPEAFRRPLRPTLDALANSANFLNMIFQASDLRESSVEEDMEWYHGLVRALMEADALIEQALLTFDADPAASVPQLVLRASRKPTPKVKAIVLQDLSKAWESLHAPAPAPDDSWFSSFKFPQSNQPMAALSKRVLLNDLRTLDTPKWGQGDSYVTNHSGVRWANAPFLDCKDGRFLPGWMLTLSTSFYGLKPDLTPEFRGVIRVDVNIQSFDVNQCATGDGWFANTHQCNRTTMECEPIPGQGFRLGQYCCRCKEGYYSLPPATQDSDGGSANRSAGGTMCYPALPICLPCWPGCKSCQDGAPCRVQEDWILRSGVLAIQGVFMLMVFVSMLAAYRHRRSRRIRASGLLLLETILFGSMLLYFPVFILYFRPSTFRCIVLRWVRMLGFSIVYGTVMLKMYRVLKVFLSRTAQRVPYMSSLHLLRILGVMLVAVVWFLCAWTVGVLQNRDRNIPVLITSKTSEGQGFSLCYLDRWDHMMAVAELLFLCWGISLCSGVRPVPSAFHEPRYMGISIHNELLLSSMFHLLRFSFPSIHPDWMLLLFFTHTHVTITVTLALLFLPKFLHVSKSGREEIAAEVYEDEVDLRRSGSYLNSSFQSAWSDYSLDPDDIRDELKKLYAQLEVNKTKKMTTNNPHLSKKRSSRRGLGKSIIKRIAEIPETMSRQCSREEKDASIRSKITNQSGSFRTGSDSISISNKGSIHTPSPVMRKSQSQHEYMRERDPSLRGSMLNANMAKRASQRSETNSLDIPPGVCKSASAQNLTLDNNLLHPDHTKLHKSRSLTPTPTRTMDTLKVNRASSVVSRSKQNITINDIKDQTTNVLQSQSSDRVKICSVEPEQERSVDKNQKHVTYATSDDEVLSQPKSPDSVRSSMYVCPWDHVPPPPPPPPEEEPAEVECESPKPQAPVSASAPVTPKLKVTKDQRVFSFRTSSHKWLSVKALVGSVDKSGKEGGLKLKKEESLSHKSQESGGTTSAWSALSSRNPSFERKTLKKRSLTTAEGKPCLVKQKAVRMSSGDSSERSPRRLVIMKSAVYPWDTEDMQKDNTYENVFISRQNSKRSSISSWETVGTSSRTPSTRSIGSRGLTPTRNVSHADVWEGPGSLLQGKGVQRQPSTIATICPWEVQEAQIAEHDRVCPWESQEPELLRRKESGRTGVCPWESQDIPTTPTVTVAKVIQQRQQNLSLAADICPWESGENPQPSKRQDDRKANVCPWEVEDKPPVIYENLNPVEKKGTLRVPIRQDTMKPIIYTSMSQDTSTDGKQLTRKSSIAQLTIDVLKLTAQHSANQASKTAQSCPWDFPEPSKTNADICPWEEENMEPPVTKTTTEGTDNTRINICPWETEQPKTPAATETNVSKEQEQIKRQDGVKADVCPWETEEPETGKMQASTRSASLEKQDTVRENVCPWETGEPKVLKKQDSGRTSVCPWETEEPKVLKRQDSVHASVCPWETEEPKVLKKQDSGRASVCPWETEEPKVLKRQDSGRASVCPWETEEPKVLKRQDSGRASVCPWETEEPKVLKKQDSDRASVCPWETEEPKVLKKQDSDRASVCPWETDEPKVLKKQDSDRASVCPWETEDPKAVKQEDSGRVDVCPWETEDPKAVKQEDSGRANVCPWETEDPKAVKQEDSGRADVCPWETEDPKAEKKEDSGRADVCPWETEDPKAVKKEDGGRADVCPWDAEGTETVTRHESTVVVDVCPWESTDPQNPTESKLEIPNSDKDEVTASQGPLHDEEIPPESEMLHSDQSKSNLPLGRRDALCPWNMERTRSGSFNDTGSDVFTWEPENIPEEDEEEADAECAAEAFIFPPDL